MLTIREKADTVATLRHASVWAMEALARWIPTTPELEAKICFGRHVWEFAQHADLLGRRTAELRAAPHFSLAPVPAYAALLAELAGTAATPARVAGFYEGFVPELARRYQAYMDATDHLLDDPSIRLMERAVTDLGRLGREARALVAERPDLADATTGPAWEARARAVTGWVAFRPAPATPEPLA
jgi:hypothetical protein